MTQQAVGLPEALERAATALPERADSIRPANGDPGQLRHLLDAEGAAQVLGWLLQHEIEAGAELADAWVEDPMGEPGEDPLLRVHEADLPKAGRKVLRRALHQLRSRGVALPEEPPAPVTAKLPQVEEELDESYVTPLDPRGGRIVYIARSHPSGGLRLFELLLDEDRGVLEFEVYNTGRSRGRRFLRELTKRERFAAVAVPGASVSRLVARVLEKHPANRTLPGGMYEWRSRLANAPEDAQSPGELAREAIVADAKHEAEDLDLVVQLLESHALGPWPPETQGLPALAQRLDQIAQGPIVVSGDRRREQIDEVIAQGAGELYDATFSAITANRFEESAYVFWKTDRDPEARACLTAARVFRESEAGENPIARCLVRVLLAPALEALSSDAATTAEDEEPTLLVKP